MSLSTANGYDVGDSDERPWGRWEVIASGDGFAVKEITVLPQQALSLQSHKHRNEHWVFIAGVGRVTLDDQSVEVGADDSVYIPVGTRHRLENTGTEPLRFIEIQTGAVLDENDIERFADRYGRTS